MYYFSKSFIFSAGFLFFLFSCSTIKPTPPKISVGTYEAPKIETSLLSIPVEMELGKYFKEADQAVPYQFKGNEQNCEGVSFSYQFDRKPIQIVGKGKYVDIDIEGKYSLSLSYCAKCTDLFGSNNCITPRIPASCGVGEPMRRIKIQYSTAIDLKNNFSLSSKTELKKIDTKDKCEITVFKYNATEHLVKEVKKALADIGKKIDDEIEALDIKKEAESIWNTFNDPIALDKYGFLTFNPKQIEVNNLKIDGSKLKFNVGLSAQPVVTSFKPNIIKSTLPNLTNLNNNEGFQINIEVKAVYDSLNNYLKEALFGKEIELKNQKIIIQECKIFGANQNQLNLEVTFIGSKSGKMYFVGTPQVNDSTQILSFPDLEFDLETKNVLLKSAKWMFNKKITDVIRNYASIDLKKYLKDVNKMIENQINTEVTKEVILKGKMNETKIKNIFPDKDILILQASLMGKLEVQIK
ncbi:MAG: DUF4403 family protein [Flavobacteriia bacterium]|nr:DUF4403 family protein [Flavobacteriia bacterium]